MRIQNRKTSHLIWSENSAIERQKLLAENLNISSNKRGKIMSIMR